MTRRRLYLILIATVALIVVIGYETTVIGRQRDELRALHESTDVLARELASLRADRTGTLHNLDSAEAQLAQLSTIPEPSASLSERETERAAWLGRVHALRQLFHDHPEHQIPEMDFLTEIDWLRVAKEADFSTDRNAREALANLRTAAKTKFNAQISAAGNRYIEAGHREPPLNLHTLVPYFDPPVDVRILERYEVATAPRAASNAVPPELEKLGLRRAGSDVVWKIQERVAIDPHFDQRLPVGFQPDGTVFYMTPAPQAWIPDFDARYRRAREAYLAQHPGAAQPGMETLLPYIDPPFEPAVAQRLLEVEQARRR